MVVDFGNTLKELRHNSGLTQKQLADRLWLSKATVSYYEQSVRYPSPEILVKLASVFHVSTDYLLGIEGKKQTLDVTDLTDEDIKFLEQAISLLRNKNSEKNFLYNTKDVDVK
jgi:transcriptional regulator with XRE-family HTH domain